MHFIRKKALARRTFLRGAGYCIALPFLDAMIPAMAYAQSASILRVAYLYFPHGIHPQKNPWGASTSGTGFSFPSGLANTNIINHRSDLILMGGIQNPWSQYGIYGDYDNDHASAAASYLTAARANWSATGTSFTLSTKNPSSGALPEAVGHRSVDVMIAEKIASSMNKIPVLHLTPSGFAPYDATTKHYSVDYRTYLSWRTSNSPTPRFEKPIDVFNALFKTTTTPTTPPPTTSGPDLDSLKKSILDLALQEVNSLKPKLGVVDNIKMDEYLTALREVERSIQSTTSTTPPPVTTVPACSSGTAPSSTLAFDAMTRTYLDLMVLAFQCDQTRVVSYMMDYELGSRMYSFAGANKYASHQASHGNFSEDYSDATLIANWYANQFAYLIGKMKSVSDAGGTLLSQSILHLGSGTNTTGGDHPDDQLPLLVAGQGGGLLTTGRAIQTNGASLANYHLSLLKKVGVNVTSFGNSSGTISGL